MKFRPWKAQVKDAAGHVNQKVISVASTDVPDGVIGGGGGYMGEYDPTKTYYGGSIVRKTSGSVQGLFAVKPDRTAYGTPDSRHVDPTFPEDPSSPWDCIGLPFQIVGVCSNGNKDIYVQATMPF